MKKITLLVLSLGIIFFTYSCKSDSNSENETNENIEVVDENAGGDDFDAFWKEFQTAVTNSDNEKLKELSTEETIGMMGDNFVAFFDDEFITRVTNTNSADVETIDANNKKFFYVIQYPADDQTGEVFESFFGFGFQIQDGQWKISSSLFAG